MKNNLLILSVFTIITLITGAPLYGEEASGADTMEESSGSCSIVASEYISALDQVRVKVEVAPQNGSSQRQYAVLNSGGSVITQGILYGKNFIFHADRSQEGSITVKVVESSGVTGALTARYECQDELRFPEQEGVLTLTVSGAVTPENLLIKFAGQENQMGANSQVLSYRRDLNRISILPLVSPRYYDVSWTGCNRVDRGECFLERAPGQLLSENLQPALKLVPKYKLLTIKTPRFATNSRGRAEYSLRIDSMGTSWTLDIDGDNEVRTYQVLPDSEVLIEVDPRFFMPSDEIKGPGYLIESRIYGCPNAARDRYGEIPSKDFCRFVITDSDVNLLVEKVWGPWGPFLFGD